MNTQSNFFIGVDVGTSSVRVGLVNEIGDILFTTNRDILIYSPQYDYYLQSSNNIWESVLFCLNQVTKYCCDNSIVINRINCIGYDATCSLVCLDSDYEPINLNLDNDNNIIYDVILWMDHRSISQANEINKTQHPVLKFVGNTISPEMQIPKIKWLHENFSNFNSISHFFDLPDFLCFKSTSIPIRSKCSVTCKFNYQSYKMDNINLNNSISEPSELKKNGWDDIFFEKINLKCLKSDNYIKIGTNENIKDVGTCIGVINKSLSEKTHLSQNTKVTVSIIDAHAGTIGCLFGNLNKFNIENVDITQRMAIIAGTSSCHMSISSEPSFVHGVWGPYYSALIPKYWLLEGGQSATGALLDYVISLHPYYNENINIKEDIYQYLNKTLYEKYDFDKITKLSSNIHILPYFHGNRSPRADSTLLGSIIGLSLRKDLENLCMLYISTIQSIAYGDKHIIETINSYKKNKISTIFVVGGLAKNDLYIQTLCDITQCNIVTSKYTETVLLGSAILAASCSYYDNILNAMNNMNTPNKLYKPNKHLINYHDKKYKIFLKLYEDFISYNDIMNK